MSLRRGQSERGDEGQFLGALPQGVLPVAAVAGVFLGEGGRVVGQAGRLGRRFLGGIDVLVPVPEPLVRPVDERPQVVGQQTGDQRGLVEPRREDAIENNGFEVDLLDPDRLELGLVVEPAGRVVVTATVARRDVERHVQAASDLVEDLMRELGAG